jgi:hypothetical protein
MQVFREENLEQERPATHCWKVESTSVVLTISCQMNKVESEADHYPHRMPNARERFRNDMHHADTFLQEWDMIVADVTKPIVVLFTWHKPGPPTARRHRFILTILESATVPEPFFDVNEGIKHPSSIREIGSNERVIGSEKVKENQMFYGRNFGLLRTKESAFGKG